MAAPVNLLDSGTHTGRISEPPLKSSAVKRMLISTQRRFYTTGGRTRAYAPTSCIAICRAYDLLSIINCRCLKKRCKQIGFLDCPVCSAINALMASASALTTTYRCGMLSIFSYPAGRPAPVRWPRQCSRKILRAVRFPGRSGAPGLRCSSPTFKPSAVCGSTSMPYCSYVLRMVEMRAAWLRFPDTDQVLHFLP